MTLKESVMESLMRSVLSFGLRKSMFLGKL